MASCKDCLHVDVCRGIYLAIISGEINSYEEFLEKCEKEHFEKQDISPCNCLFYKGRSRFVELPCKVGDTVYIALNGYGVLKDTVKEFRITNRRIWIRPEEFGMDCLLENMAFLTREEAEQALKEREKTSGDSPGGEG